MKTEMRTDGQTTLEDLKNAIRQFCEARHWDPYHNPKDLAIGLVTESSELLEIFRFQKEADLAALLNDPEQREHIADELADSIYFILRFAQLFDFDLSQCVKRKLVKNALKYPEPS